MIDPARAVRALTSVLRQVVGFGANAVFLLSLLLFMGIDSTGAAPGWPPSPAQRPLLAGALRSFAAEDPSLPRRDHRLRADHRVADTLLLLWLESRWPSCGACWPRSATTSRTWVSSSVSLPPAVLALLIGGWPLMLTVIVAYILLELALHLPHPALLRRRRGGGVDHRDPGGAGAVGLGSGTAGSRPGHPDDAAVQGGAGRCRSPSDLGQRHHRIRPPGPGPLPPSACRGGAAGPRARHRRRRNRRSWS